MESKYIIKCPKCGREYMAAEIFYPNSLLGKPYDIFKDEKGHIEFWSGDDVDPHEEFICEECNTPFTVTAKISFSAEIDKLHDFNEDYESKIYSRDRLTLKENDNN